MFSGWTIPGVPVGAAAPASKWHLRVNLLGSLLVYLNVQLDPQRRQTTIMHEAVVRVWQTFHSFYVIFVRAELGEVGSLVADAIVRADRRRPTNPAERTRHATGCSRCSPHGQVPQGRMEG
jgi:hypothetical protein